MVAGAVGIVTLPAVMMVVLMPVVIMVMIMMGLMAARTLFLAVMMVMLVPIMVIVMVVLMLLILMGMVVVLLFLRLMLCPDALHQLVRQRHLLHGGENGLAAQLIPGRGDDGRVRVLLPQQRCGGLQLLGADLLGAA